MKKADGEHNRSESPEKSITKTESGVKQHVTFQVVKTRKVKSVKSVTPIKTSKPLNLNKTTYKSRLIKTKPQINSNPIKQPFTTNKFSAQKKNIFISKRICQMQKFILELKSANKSLKYENDYLRKAALRSMTSFLCAKELNEELQRTNEKCKDLELLVNQKNDIIERYQILLKDISHNVSILMSDLENDNNKSDGFVQEKLRRLSQIQQQSECFNGSKTNFKQIILNGSVNKARFDNSISSSSDTLIDADLSFEISKRSSQEPRILDFQFKPIDPSILSSFDGSLSMENNCISNQDNDDDDEDDDKSLTLPLDDMSITTIATSEIQKSLTESNSSKNEEFQNGLNELDQKIFKAKKLLESIKIK